MSHGLAAYVGIGLAFLATNLIEVTRGFREGKIGVDVEGGPGSQRLFYAMLFLQYVGLSAVWVLALPVKLYVMAQTRSGKGIQRVQVQPGIELPLPESPAYDQQIDPVIAVTEQAIQTLPDWTAAVAIVDGLLLVALSEVEVEFDDRGWTLEQARAYFLARAERATLTSVAAEHIRGEPADG